MLSLLLLALGGSHLLWGHLLLLSNRTFLQEGEGFVCLLLEIVDIGHKLDRIDHLLVFDEHSSDLACCISVLLLDDRVDVVSNLLPALVRLLNSHQFVNIH